MIQELIQIKESDSLDAVCARFGEFLGLNQPVKTNVMKRVLEDQLFAHDLISCRNTPGFLSVLLNDPVNNQYEVSHEVEDHSTLELTSRITKALINWGKAGFSKVDPKIYTKRMSACEGCSHFVEPPRKLIYKLIKKVNKEAKICNLCGCVASRKALLPSESCPAPHDKLPGMSKWEEPLQEN